MMPVELNHTIVAATDRDRTADFLVDILGLRPATTYGPFRVVALANGVSLDVVGSDGPFPITQSGSLEHHPHRPAPAAACDDMAEPDLGRPG
jgi:catechol 2,3-dioxygenase-like lactoylglutathione lyase family enzyme